MSCVPLQSFTPIYFDYSSIVASNLGGQGGRCVDAYASDGSTISWRDMCEQQQPTLNVPDSSPTSMDGNMDILIRNVGNESTNGEVISLRITNVSEYRGWNTRQNGVKRQVLGANVGYFGAINLLAPRSDNHLPVSTRWTDHFTMVQLKFCFVNDRTPHAAQSTLAPITLGRTFITFCTCPWIADPACDCIRHCTLSPASKTNSHSFTSRHDLTSLTDLGPIGSR
jgi:hypothetical protein